MTYQLTGKKRYRLETSGWFYKRNFLVLEVEVAFGDGPTDHNGLPQHLSGAAWRDARVEDLLELKEFN
jgi:hypothetical protein